MLYLTRCSEDGTHANKKATQKIITGSEMFHLVDFTLLNKMSNKTVNDTDSDVSELDPKELSDTLNYDKYACQLGYAEDPETPLTADTFPSKSGGKPVSFHGFVYITNLVF